MSEDSVGFSKAEKTSRDIRKLVVHESKLSQQYFSDLIGCVIGLGHELGKVEKI
jgi:hypothetical protein